MDLRAVVETIEMTSRGGYVVAAMVMDMERALSTNGGARALVVSKVGV